MVPWARAVSSSYKLVTNRSLRDVTRWGEPPSSATCSPQHEMLAVHTRRAEECTASSSARAVNVLEQAGSPQMYPGAVRAAAAAAVHHTWSCTWPHDLHRCTNRCAHVRYAWPERRRAPPIAPTDPPTLTRVRRRACCRRPHLIGAASSRRAAGGRSVEDIITHDYTANGAVGAGPACEQQRSLSWW